MSTLSDELRRIGVRSSDEEFLELVVDVVRNMPSAAPIHGSEREFTAEEIAVLKRGGFSLGPFERQAGDPVSRFIATYAGLLATSSTATEVALMLKVDSSRIRQRLGAGTLFGIKTEGGWRLPRFQFDGQQLVPGIERVFPQIDPVLHPVAVYRWFTLPDPDLEVGDDTLSPRDWLLSGGNPAAIAPLAPGLY